VRSKSFYHCSVNHNCHRLQRWATTHFGYRCSPANWDRSFLCQVTQAPGTNFVWNEFRLRLSPECDYRLAEKRLLEVVEDVYARYRDTVQRQYHELERDAHEVRVAAPAEPAAPGP
jgi:hypothetical protein